MKKLHEIQQALEVLGVWDAIKASSGGGSTIVSGASNFISLLDTPSSYLDQVNKALAVNATEDGVKFVDLNSQYLQIVNNLSDVADVPTARANLNVYSTSEVVALLHDPVTVLDSDTIDFTLNNQQITAVVKINSINDTHINWGLGTNQVNSSDVPDHNSHTVRDTFVHIINRGKSSAITISLTGGLGISWTTGELYDKASSTFFSTEAGSGNLTDNAVNYLKWVSGTMLTISTSGTDSDEVLVATFSVYDGVINSYRETSLINETMANTRRGLRALFPTRIISGMSISEDTDATNTLDVKMDAGVLYKDAIEKMTPVQILSRNAKLVRHFHTGGVWDFDEISAEINTANYDNGTGLVVIPTATKWVKALFLYQAGKIGWVYPNATYATKAQALDSPLPAVPPGLAPIPKLTAIVYKKDDTTFVNTTWQDVRAGISEESFNVVTDHGALAGLADDDHVQYLLADGTRALAGTWDMGNFALTNVNIDSGDINTAVTQTEWDTAYSHSQLTSGNPHSVTKTEVGLGNVPNLDFSNASNITTGTLPSSVLPPLAITETYVVANEVAQLALTVQEGDVAVRIDENKSYIALNADNVDMGDWQELLTPTDTVLSVNGQTGVVVLNQDHIGDGATYVRTHNDLTDALKINYNAAYTHSQGDGSDHANVATNTAGIATNVTAIGSNTTHRNDNTQAHSDYLINNGSDSTSGSLTAADYYVTNEGQVGVSGDIYFIFDVNEGAIYTSAYTNFGIGVLPNVYSFDIAAVTRSRTSFLAKNTGIIGSMLMVTGGATKTGYLEWRGAAADGASGTRYGYMGYDTADISLNLENGADFFVQGGKMSIGTTSSGAKLHIDQASTTAAIPVLILDQGDVDQPFIEFKSGTVYTSKTAQDEYLMVKDTSGNTRYLRLYS